jgi:hypothetical protein
MGIFIALVVGIGLGRFAWDPTKKYVPILWAKLKEKYRRKR